MEKATYNKLVKMYDGLKAVNQNSAKLPPVTRAAIDFAALLAVRNCITTWDMENSPHGNFLEFLTAEIAEAQYNCALIIAEREGVK